MMAQALRFGLRFVLALTLGALVYLIAISPNNRPVVIEAGPSAGFFYQTGQALAEDLSAQGFDVELRSRNDTLTIVDNVENADHPVNVGFVAQALDTNSHPSVTSLGSIVLEPLLLFVRSDLTDEKTDDMTVSQLQGRSVWMQVQGSGFDQLAGDVFDAYGLNVERQYGPIAEGIASLRDGQTDALGLLFPVDTPLVQELSTDPDLTMLALPNTAALANQLDYVQQMTIPPGVFDLKRPSPPRPLDTVGLPVTVVAHQGLPDAAVLAITKHLEDRFGGASASGIVDEFPNFSDGQLPRNTTAEDYYKNGTPWQFKLLPGWLAEALGKILVLGFLALFFDLVYKVLYVHGALWTKFIEPRQRRKLLATIDQLETTGQAVPLALQHKIENLAEKVSQDQRDKERITQLAKAFKNARAAQPEPPMDPAVDPKLKSDPKPDAH